MINTEQLAGRVVAYTNRRKSLAKVGAGTLGALAGLLGLSQRAAASSGCNLCKSASSSCSGCACVWCWHACVGWQFRYKCCECYKPGHACSGDCSGVKCSSEENVGFC